MKSLLFYFLLCQGAGGLGALASRSALRAWYPGLRKPWFNPPNRVFGPVWTVLYTLMAIAAYRCSGHPAFYLQLVLNAIWTPLFFGLRAPGWALIDIGLLWAAIAWWISLVDPLAGWLLAPYWCWVSFALVLNFEIWRLNK